MRSIQKITSRWLSIAMSAYNEWKCYSTVRLIVGDRIARDALRALRTADKQRIKFDNCD